MPQRVHRSPILRKCRTGKCEGKIQTENYTEELAESVNSLGSLGRHLRAGNDFLQFRHAGSAVGAALQFLLQTR